MTLSGRDVSDLLATHRAPHPDHALGQNFVVDPNTVRRIARLAEVGPGDRVIEIGAGLGSLTLTLAETGADVTAPRVDRGLVPVLREVVEPVGVRVVEADALKVDWRGCLATTTGPWWRTFPTTLPLRSSRSVGRRPTDHPDARDGATRGRGAPRRRVGDEGYGAVSVKVAYWARAEVVGPVPATVFLPKPKVESALVRIVRQTRPR